MHLCSFRGWSIGLTLVLFTAFLAEVGHGIVLPSSAIISPVMLNWKNFISYFELSVQSSSIQDVHIQPSGGIRSDFWERAGELSTAVHKYTDDLLHLAAVLSASAAAKVDEFKSTMNEIISSTAILRAEVQAHIDLHGLTLDDISEKLSTELAVILQELETEFPAPKDAPDHERRVRMVSTALSKVEDCLVRLLTSYGLSETDIRARFGDARSKIEVLLVTTGDLIEQHPDLLGIILFSGAALILPEIWFLRPVLGLFGFGPYGPVKGSSAALAQRFFWGDAVQAGSWFARLQAAAMKFPNTSRPVWFWEQIAVAFAVFLSLFRCH